MLRSAMEDCERVRNLVGEAYHFKTTLLAGMISLQQEDFDGAVEKGKKALGCAAAGDEDDKAMDFLNSAMAARVNARRGSATPRRADLSPEELRIITILEEMSIRSPCEILGVKATASRTEVMAAYHVLAKQYHPDKPGGDTRLFQRLEEAKRALYP
ncbi:hypothetical protein DL93DRAFT_660524 [Clavulina sp. PMI_390]|nr:hypothetical protein DL93DRAFT_660524 [Clavulina sp. PMI_390]